MKLKELKEKLNSFAKEVDECDVVFDFEAIYDDIGDVYLDNFGKDVVCITLKGMEDDVVSKPHKKI